MQTSPLNRPVYFCWAAGGNMCLTSVSLARRFAAGLHCPLTATPLKWTGDNGWFQRVITVQSMSSCLRTALLADWGFLFGSNIVSHFESAVYTTSLKRALERQQLSKHKVRRVPRHNKLSKTIKPCTTCSASKGRVRSNFKTQNYSEMWCTVTVHAGESERADPSCSNNYCWGAHNQNSQTAPAVRLMIQWKKNAWWLPGVDL